MRSQISDKWKHFSRYALLAATVACTALLFGCGETGGGGGTPSDTASYELSKADSCDDVRERVVESTTEDVLRNRYKYNAGGGVDGSNDSAEEGDPAGDGSRDDSGSESPDDYTETNTQEEDVDEDDFVKTDGDYIYTVQGDELLIVDSWPADETS
ncbi:MAG: beta-propeller domain-containing protein, partial [Persicimonas sp.]